MTCEDFQHLLDNYESLTETEKMMLMAHTSECETCRKELSFLLSIINVTKTLPEIEPPSDFLEKLNARIDVEEIKEHQLQRRIRRSVRKEWKRYGSVAACLLLAVIVGFNGRTLVSDMTENNSGVITEERVISDDSIKPSEFDVMVPTGVTVEKTSDISDTEVTKETAAPTATKAPVKANVKNTDAPVAAKTNNIENKTAVTKQSEATSIPMPTATATAQPTQRPSDNTENEENIQSQSDNSVEETEAYTLTRDRYRIPIESIPYNESSSASNAKSATEVNGYSIAGGKAELALGMYTPIDKDGNPTEYKIDVEAVNDVPSGSSILVSSEDEEKVKSLMNRYITDNYNMYYMTTEDKLNELLEEMDKAGINYEKFIRNSSEKVSFKLVVIS